MEVEEWELAVSCVLFCVRVAEYQMSKGRLFYFEHPLSATTWALEEVANLRNRKDVEDITVHMCQFGLQARDEEGPGLVKKPTRILTNMPSIATAVDRQCCGGHRHVHLVSGRTKGSAAYIQ